MDTKQDMAGIIERLGAVAQHDWRISFLAHTSDTAKEAIARIMELESALEPFCASGDATMEELLWGKISDESLGTISVRLKHFRAARTALRARTHKGEG